MMQAYMFPVNGQLQQEPLLRKVGGSVEVLKWFCFETVDVIERCVEGSRCQAGISLVQTAAAGTAPIFI